jgi:hypothetical protein
MNGIIRSLAVIATFAALSAFCTASLGICDLVTQNTAHQIVQASMVVFFTALILVVVLVLSTFKWNLRGS